MRYNIEIIPAETGEEKSQNYLTFGQVETLLVGMQEGDDLVIHCLGNQSDLL